MSSILRALKKLENDPRHLEKPQTLESKFVSLADTGQQKISTGLLLMIIGAGLVCGLVILTGWWLLSDKTLQQPVAPQQISRQNQQQPEAGPVRPEKSALQQEQELAASSDISSEPAKTAAGIIAAGEVADHPAEQVSLPLPQPSSPIIEQKEIKPIAAQTVKPILQTPETLPTETIEPESSQKVAVMETSPPAISEIEKAVIPLLNDPDMKLQAITWSKDPQKRIAVINNSILRQGEVVSGYRIDAINQDDVVLNDRGKKWKIIFRIR